MSKIIFFDEHLEISDNPNGKKMFWRISSYVFVKRDNKVLMIIPEWHDVWELPGGEVELDETLSDAAIRECYEETGYKITIKKKKPIFTGEQFFRSRYLKKYFHSVIVVFEAELITEKRDIHTIDAVYEQDDKVDRISKVDWVDVSTLNKNNCHPNFYQLIRNGGNKT